jgi:ribosome modulation factor
MERYRDVPLDDLNTLIAEKMEKAYQDGYQAGLMDGTESSYKETLYQQGYNVGWREGHTYGREEKKR